jgi:ABC-type transport system substrate-binding protein
MRVPGGRLLLALLAFVMLAVPAVARPLTVALQLEPPNLDPTSGAAVAIDEVTYGTVFESLVRLDAQGAVKPWLATNWTVSDDGLTYVFRLRPGVRFHDGAPFGAADAAFSLTRRRRRSRRSIMPRWSIR